MVTKLVTIDLYGFSPFFAFSKFSHAVTLSSHAVTLSSHAVT
ncbi:hypothetical protein [Planktothrix tepida]|nr:hypothetical protein [Planktothrix tepida]